MQIVVGNIDGNIYDTAATSVEVNIDKADQPDNDQEEM